MKLHHSVNIKNSLDVVWQLLTTWGFFKLLSKLKTGCETYVLILNCKLLKQLFFFFFFSTLQFFPADLLATVLFCHSLEITMASFLLVGKDNNDSSKAFLLAWQRLKLSSPLRSSLRKDPLCLDKSFSHF